MAIKKEKKEAKKKPAEKEIVKDVKEISEFPKMNFFNKIKKMFFKPATFFGSVEKENRYTHIINTLLIIYVVYFILFTLSDLIIGGIGASGKDYFIKVMTGFVSIVVAAIISPFIWAGIVHVGVLVFKGKEKYLQTFKPVTYALAIGIIYSIIGVIIAFVLQLIIPVDSSMLQSLDPNVIDPQAMINAYQAYYSQPVPIVLLVISVISLIHQFIFMFNGLAKFQKLSKKRAAWAIILPIIVVIAFAILISIVLSFSQLMA